MSWSFGNVLVNTVTQYPVPVNNLFLVKANLTGGVSYSNAVLAGKNFLVYVEGLGFLRFKQSNQTFPNSYYSKQSSGFTILIPGFDLDTNQIIVLY